MEEALLGLQGLFGEPPVRMRLGGKKGGAGRVEVAVGLLLAWGTGNGRAGCG
jgi:hypothetical protein